MAFANSSFRFLPISLSSSSRTFATSSRTASHVGSAPIPFPSTVTFESLPRPTSSVSSLSSSSTQLSVKGPKGRLEINVPPFVQLNFSSPTSDVPTNPNSPSPTLLSLAVQDASIKHQRAAWGLTRSLLANAVRGVSDGYDLSLRLVGVGYRAAVEEVASSSAKGGKGQRLNLKLGFAHPVLINLPADVQAATPSSTTIVLSGIDKQRLGEVAARIRRWRIPRTL